MYFDYSKPEKAIGYTFKDKKLLELALTHSSFANEFLEDKKFYNERIEFLGDAVLELVSSDYFYKNMPTSSEGDMTRLRAAMVCEPTLALCARQIGLENYIRLSKGEDKTGGRDRDSIISDAMESVIGAIYLDSGIDAAREFIMRTILDDIEGKRDFYDSKTTLQEIAQDRKIEIEYVEMGETGPAHARTFKVAVMLGGEKYGEGTGKSKKAAQQKAAYEALKKIRKNKKV